MGKKVDKEKGEVNMDYHLIKEGDLFLLTDQAGNILKNEDIQYGLYAKDTRFLSSYELFLSLIHI